MIEPGRRRRRPAVSCTLCRRRKIRCNREIPCSNCVRSKNEACVYENEPLPQRQQHQGANEHDGASSISTASTTPASDVDSLKSRIRHLEGELQRMRGQPATSGQSTQSPTSAFNSKTKAASSGSTIEAATSHIGGTFFIHHGNPDLGQPPWINRSVTHKKRMFGQSHWMNHGIVLVRDTAEMIDEHAREVAGGQAKIGTAKVIAGMQRCKHLARIIKSRRTPPWPCTPTPDLPPKDIADDLVDRYLRTSEAIHRILHVPSFKRDYEALWVTETEPDKTFLVQLKVVLAIGAATYNDNFTLRPSAIRWVYEAEAWLSDPSIKQRLGLQFLQIHALIVIAREMTGVGEDHVWISAGALYRSAIFMGLHRDPAQLPTRTIFANEMHRRLWSTILELCLQTSLNSGGPPLVSLDDFDTQPPCNFDDDQLTNEDAVPRPDTEFTQVSVAIALRRTLPVRLAVTKFLNHYGSSGTYEETLRLDTDFRLAYKALRSSFQELESSQGPSPSKFEIRLVDIIMLRYLSSLHMPYFPFSLHDSAHAYSRKVVVDAALKMWYAASPPSPMAETPYSDTTSSSGRDDLMRIIICGNGFLRTGTLQAVLVIAVEIRNQMQEDDGLGPMPLRRDLLAVVEEAKRWQLWCIEAGETNVKGYVFACLMSAHIEGLIKGLMKDELPALLVKSAEDAEEKALAILEKTMEKGIPEQHGNELNGMTLDVTPDMFEGWDAMMPDIPFDFNNMDPMSWTFDQGSMQASSFLW